MSFELLLFIVGFGIYAVLQSIYSIVVNDTWWHLKVGEQLWNGTFTFEDQFSWTVPGAFWPAHELAFEWLMYGLWLLGGKTFVLVSIFNTGLMIATLLLLLPTKTLRDRVNGRINWIVPIILLLAGIVLVDFIQIRAQAFSFFFFALTIRLIISKKPLWIPLVFLVWVWIHGSVLIGIGITGLATVIVIGRWLLDRKNKEKAKDALKFSIGGILSLVATLLSPLGFKLWEYFVQTFTFKDSNIQEWQPIWTAEITFFQAIAIGIMAIPALYLIRKVLLTWEMIFLVSTFLFLAVYSLSALRVFGNLALIAVPIFTLAAMVNWNRFPKKKPTNTKRAIYAVTSVIVITASIFYSITTSTGILAASARNPFTTNNIDTALRSDECSNSLWNDYDAGAFLIWFMPDIKVSIDSRFDLYPRWVTEATGVVTAPGSPYDPTALLNVQLQKYEINCLLFVNNSDSDALKDRGLAVIAENQDMVLLRLENHTIPLGKDS